MTIQAQVTVNGHTEHFVAGPLHEDAVRFRFNPSALPSVTRIKMLTSLLVAEIDGLKTAAPADSGSPHELGPQEIFTRARQLAVDASMWTVLGATKGLP